ncbi:beta-defensin 107A-like [Phacochoerus africanus]|uniref:beta-defensin 107A-like n=1 Tax=Phacochoerus africanus TaxID=41426 RepID=UPI001FDA908F|nr:beta-defensin 107A-like [Phacochoerus africanus]
MKIFFLMFAAIILLAHIFSARGGLRRQILCHRMASRCEVKCLSFEDKLGGCRAELTPFCCKKKKE